MRVNCSYKEMRDLVNLVPHDKNSNKHPDKQIKLLAKIMDFQGWRHPIVVSNLSGKIVAGHGRMAAAQLLGWEKAPIDLQDFKNEAEEILFLTSDNKIAELADHDDSMMIDNIKEFGIEDFELLGLDDFELSTELDDEKEIKPIEISMIECPHCFKQFEKNQSKEAKLNG